jgi:hypothetical protein
MIDPFSFQDFTAIRITLTRRLLHHRNLLTALLIPLPSTISNDLTWAYLDFLL